jgi:tripartite ATP-independent transporter DctM subunit
MQAGATAPRRISVLDALNGRFIDHSRQLAFVGVMAILLVALVTAVDILLRWLADGAVPGFNEFLTLAISVAIAATFPAGAAGRVNLAVDLFAQRLGRNAVRWLNVVGALLLFAFYGFLLVSLYGATGELGLRHAATMILRVPEAPFMWAVTAFLALALAAQLMVFLATLRDALAGIDIEGGSPKVSNARGTSSAASLSVPRRRLALFAVGFAVALAAVLLGLQEGFSALSAVARAAPGTTAIVLFLMMWVAVFALVPLAAAMGLVGVLGTALLLGVQPALTVLGTTVVEYVTSDQLAVLPLFLIMGSFAGVAGLSQDIYDLAHILVGHRRGGLALATIGGCAGFGMLTGSSVATTATIGQVALPEMQARGYSPALSTGCVAAGGTLGQLVPPSTALILYALLTEESIGALFIAAIVPAALAVLLYCIAVWIFVRLRPNAAPAATRGPTMAEVVRGIGRAWGVLLLFAIIIGGIYGGVFTVTEAAAVGAGCSFLFALARGKLKGGALLRVIGETTATTAMLYIIFFGAVTFSYFMGLSGLPEMLTTAFEGANLAPIAIVALILVVFTFLGCIMDSFAVMVITVPILAPFITHLGYSLVWWGVINLVVVETGMITPPFGINVFILKSLLGSDVPMSVVFRGVTPFVFADFLKLALIVLFPVLVTWLPSTMMH